MNQDVLIVIGAAAFASVLLIAGFMWELERSRRPLAGQAAEASGSGRRIDAPGDPTPQRPADATRSTRAGRLRSRRRSTRPSRCTPSAASSAGTRCRARSGRPSRSTYLDEDVVASRIGAVTPTGPVIRRPNRILVAGMRDARSSGRFGRRGRPAGPRSTTPGPRLVHGGRRGRHRPAHRRGDLAADVPGRRPDRDRNAGSVRRRGRGCDRVTVRGTGHADA